MTNTVIAKRYAKALFAVAKEEGKLEAYSEALKDIDAFLEGSPDVEAALVSPVFPADIKQTVLEEIIKASGVEDALAIFLRLLVERGRIQYLRMIVSCFQEFMDEETGVVRAVVRSAVPLPKDLRDKFSDVLAKVTGKQVTLQIEEDPAIIGGVVAHIGDMVLDGSIRSQLHSIRESIGRGELG
ncbi:MAG: F0F1 ATP synthase subunit delta [Deltaproteobacteria bacterium]|nr:F0F1 ATP synthase subunit delta [Deltaproteobacteria bacterium]